jgi:hypothetical protein
MELNALEAKNNAPMEKVVVRQLTAAGHVVQHQTPFVARIKYIAARTAICASETDNAFKTQMLAFLLLG